MRTILLLVMISSQLASVAMAASVNEELQGVHREIREKRRQLKRTAREERKVSGELQQIERSLREKEESLRQVQQQLATAEAGVDRTLREIHSVETEIQHKQQEINRRLVASYKGGEMGAVRAFFSADSFPQMTENLRYMQAVLQHDRKLLDEYHARIERLKGLKQTLERDVARKEKVRRDVEAKKQDVEQERHKKSSYLSKVQQDKKSYTVELKELEANARRLQSMVEKLEASRRRGYTGKVDKGSGIVDSGPPVPDKGLGSQKGRLSLPARGEIIGRFGRHKHPQFATYTVSNGITIAAPVGSDIRAVYDGKVIFADYFKGYGNMMIVDHGGGFFSLYAHAARLNKKVGTPVARNDVIGAVGDVDSSKGSALYFEIRYQGKPVDPSPWFH